MNKGVMLVLGTAIISGFSIFLNKFGVSGFTPAVFTFLKNLTVGLILIGLLLAAKDWKLVKNLKKKEWGKLVLIGLIGGSIPFLLFFTGLKMTSAASAGFIHKTMFLWVGIFSLLFLREKLDKKMGLAAALLIGGNFLLLKISGFEISAGAGLIFLATLFWAAEILLSKSVLNVDEIPGRLVAAGRMFFGGIFLFGYVAATGKFSSIFTYSSGQWLWILVTSILLFGYVLTFYSGLKTISPVTATTILLLGTPITILLNVIFMGATIVPQQIIGIFLVAIGVLMSILSAGYFSKVNETVTTLSR